MNLFHFKCVFFYILFTLIYCDILLDKEEDYLVNGEYIAMIVLDKIDLFNNKRNNINLENIKDTYIKETNLGYLIISKDISSLEDAIDAFSFLSEDSKRVIELNREITFLNDIPKHLDRIDQLNNNYDHIYNPPNNGMNQLIYIIDTGIDSNHQEFDNNKVINFYEGVNGCIHEHLHGTAVAGYVGGNTIGTASNVTIINVPFYDETKNCDNRIRLARTLLLLDNLLNNITDGSIITMSWSFSRGSPCIDFYMEQLYKIKNIILVAAAGNSGDDIEPFVGSPQRSNYVINVGSIDSLDNLASFSNFGLGVDIYAQGVNTIHPLSGTLNKYTTGSGTSYSSPLVAGVIAIILNENNTIDKTNIKNELVKLSVKNKIPQLSINDRILNFSKADTIKIDWSILSSVVMINIIFY